MNRFRRIALLLALGSVGLIAVFAQPPRGLGPPTRVHTVTKSATLRLVPATAEPTTPNSIQITVEGDARVIRANGIPAHKTGRFPNAGNPNPIQPQRYEYRIPARPQIAERIVPLSMQSFGIAVNGVPFDPGAAEFYLGRRGSKWQYEPLSGAVALGIDASHAHVQPTGAYHYHGLPTDLLSSLNLKADAHSPLVGWAADGFPIYAVFGYSDPKDARSPIRPLTSSYRLKKGARPGAADPHGEEPGGEYDGTFVADYEYDAGSGDLDECNGRFTITPDFPDGSYAYFLTEGWPVIPRHYRGTPSEDFVRRGPPRGRRPPPRPE